MSLASSMPMSPSAEQRGFGGSLVAASSPIAAGAVAPAFALAGALDQKVALSGFVSQTVILAFNPADWSPVCTDQLALYYELLPLFAEHRAQVLGISVDGVWSHRAFAKDRNLRFPLLSDFEPKGAVSRAYGVYSEEDGTSERALFVIDRAGIVRWSFVSPSGVNPGADGNTNADITALARAALAAR
jgi:peroxiredoxin